MLNQHIRDNLNELRSTPFNRCAAYNSAVQTITAGAAFAALTLNSEEYDTASMHSNVTNNSRITIPTGGGGTYRVYARTRKDGVNGLLELELRKNGGGTAIAKFEANTSSVITAVICDEFVLAAGDYLELYAAHSSNNTDLGSASAHSATRLVVSGPLPPS